MKHSSKKIDLDMLEKALEPLGTSFTLYDNSQGLIFANRAARESFSILFEILEQGFSFEEATRYNVIQQYPEMLEEDVEHLTNQLCEFHKNGVRYDAHGSNGRIIAVVHSKIDEHTTLGVGMDISELKNSQIELKKLVSQNFRLASLDQLTDLANRRHFIEILESVIADSQVDQSSFHIGLLDLDDFKRVNDTYGHGLGDLLLKNVADRLKAVLPEATCLARLGGDEFIILCRNVMNEEELVALGNKICCSIREPYDLDGNVVKISTSLGWCCFPKNGNTVTDILNKSDYALYQSKKMNKGLPVIFSNEHEQSILRQSNLCYHLEKADVEEELYVNFQPIHDILTGRIIAFEALARWDNCELGNIDPSEFIPLAEKIGCINKITQILLQKTLGFAKNWPKDIDLHFNLSGLDVCKPLHISNLVEIVKHSDFVTNLLVFEITETAVIDNLDDMSGIFECLKKSGIRLSLDDFGTGYSSLSHLTKIPVSSIKIDKSFTDRFLSDPIAESVLKTIFYLCQNLQVECIVEGVENQTQIKRLQSMNLNSVQGYYFSKPLSTDAISAYILRHNFIDTKASDISKPNQAIAL